MSKIKTYEFRWLYKGTDEEDSTQFCAGTKKEAMELFEVFVKENNNFEYEGLTCEVVYCHEDKLEYGSAYWV